MEPRLSPPVADALAKIGREGEVLPIRRLVREDVAAWKTMEYEAIHIFRVVDGRLAETWAQRDELGMLRQLGHFTLQPRAAA